MPLDLGNPLADVDELVRKVAAEIWAPPPPVDFTDWACRNVVFGGESPFPGPFDPERFPWVPGILEALAPDHPARVVVEQGSAQIGKSVVAEVFAGGSLDLDPGPFLYIHPTQDNCLRWVKQKWKVRVRSTTALRTIFGVDKTRDGGNSLLYQERRDGRGFLQVSGANSEASLSMISVPRQVQDDLAKWDTNAAGDPESQADNRSKAFEWAKILKISTPLVAPGCRISAAYKRSTQGEFHVPCPHCDVYQALTWANFRDNIDADRPELAHFMCEACGCAIEQKHRESIVRRGRWVHQNPAAAASGIWGFYIWTAYAATESWASLARRWVDAKGDPAREQTFLNDDAGLPYEPAGEAPPHESIRKRADESGLERGVIPAGGLLLAIGVDCQVDRCEVHVKAYGRNLFRATVEYFVIEGHVSEDRARAALDALLSRTWKDAYGNRRKFDMLAIDAGYSKTDVHDWAKKHPFSRVIMVRGVHGDNAPMLAPVKEERLPDGRVIKYQKRFWNVGAAVLKSSLYKLLQKSDPAERGFCAYPVGMDEEFYRQLTAERRQPVKNKRTGITEYRWVKIQGQPNEVLDTEIYAEAAAIRLGWRHRTEAQWDELAGRLERPPADRQLDFEEMLAAGGAKQAPLATDAADQAPAETATEAGTETPISGAGPDARPRRSDWINGGRRGGWIKR